MYELANYRESNCIHWCRSFNVQNFIFDAPHLSVQGHYAHTDLIILLSKKLFNFCCS